MGVYEDLLEESKQQVAAPLVGGGMANPNPSMMENVLSTMQALDPSLYPALKAPLVIAPLMTKWKKMLPVQTKEWDIGSYPHYFKRLKENLGFVPALKDFSPSVRLDMGKDIISRLRTAEEDLSNAKALSKRMEMYPVGGNKPDYYEALSQAKHDTKTNQEYIKSLKSQFERLKRTIGDENFFQPKKQIPTLPDKRKLTGGSKAREVMATLEERRGTIPHKEASQLYKKAEDERNIPHAWREMWRKFSGNE